MLNRVTWDLHAAIVKLPERWTAGDKNQNYVFPDALTASPPSQSFPRCPDLSVAGPVVPRDAGGITVHWPSVTGRWFNWSVSVGSLQIVCSRTCTNAMTNRSMLTIACCYFIITKLETDVSKAQYVFTECVCLCMVVWLTMGSNWVYVH